MRTPWWIEMLGLWLLVSTPAGAAGMVLPEAPPVPPGTVSEPSASALEVARARHQDGDAQGVVTVLTPWLDLPAAHGRTRSAAHLLLGMAHRELGNWNLASAHFTKVRTSGGPLAPWGAWYEAQMDFNRGRYAVAVSECNAYTAAWPEGPHLDACLFLKGDAYAALGQRGASLAAYKTLLEDEPESPRAETVRLAIALAVAQSSPKTAIPMLHDLVLSHSYHSSALAAQARLDELEKLGHVTKVPDDYRSQMRAAESARRCGHLDEAWSRFEALAALAPDNPEIALWVEANEDRFAWLTRKYEHYATALQAQFDASPSAELAWQIFNAYRRDGQWKAALAWAGKSQEKFASSSRWRGLDTELAWTALLARDYADAGTRWAKLAERGGAGAREAHFYSGFSAYLRNDPAAAEEHLGAVIASGRDWVDAAYYWRYRLRTKSGDTAGAQQDLLGLAAADDTGWYGLLLRQADPSPPTAGWVARDGSWKGPPRRTVPLWTKPALGSTTLAHVTVDALEMPVVKAGWAGLTWEKVSAKSAREPDADAPSLAAIEMAVPTGIDACTWYEPDTARKGFRQFSETHAHLWPDLPAAYDLALAGMDEQAGAIVHAAYEEWKAAQDGAADDARSAELRAVVMTSAEWRDVFLVARDYNHAARFCMGLARQSTSEEDRADALRLAYPIVAGRSVWSYGETYGVDPLLMMAIMRQESVYQPTVVSVANAVGLVQVLPSTGAKVAAMLEEPRYTPGDLEIPDTNLRYGTYYMSLLLKRFDGVFPLAVASYNGGPHNMSRFLEGFPDGTDIDVYVEHIPLKESRDYVKKVSGHYANYVALYAPVGARLVIPPKTKGDHREVVDF